MEQSFAVTDPQMLRALAHPVRQRIMWELAARDHARAADLADVLGEPANSVSFHLRSLAKAGLIEEAPEHARDSRDRVWHMTHPEGLYLPPTEDGTASDPFLAERLDWLRGIMDESIPRDPQATRMQYMGAVVLTKAESLAMAEEVAQVFERYRALGAERAAAEPDNPDRVFQFTAAFIGNPRPGGPQNPVEVHDLGDSVVDRPRDDATSDGCLS